MVNLPPVAVAIDHLEVNNLMVNLQPIVVVVNQLEVNNLMMFLVTVAINHLKFNNLKVGLFPVIVVSRLLEVDNLIIESFPVDLIQQTSSVAMGISLIKIIMSDIAPTPFKVACIVDQEPFKVGIIGNLVVVVCNILMVVITIELAIELAFVHQEVSIIYGGIQLLEDKFHL